MSVQAMARVWEYRGLSITDKLILLAYADHANHDGENIYPAVQSVADKTGSTRRTVQRTTKRLVEMGVLIPDGEGTRSTNRWRMDMEWGGRNSDAPIKQEGGRHADAGGGVFDDRKGRNSDARTISNHPLNRQETTTPLTPKTKKDPPNGGATPFSAFLAYCSALGIEPSTLTKSVKSKECRFAKELLEAGWAVDDIGECTKEVKAQPFWHDKPLSLASVAKEIAQWKHKRTIGQTVI